MRLLFIVGTRPNFMKLAPLIKECNKKRIEYVVIHTGQHYSKFMSDSFFSVLKLPKPNYNLSIHGGEPSKVVGKMMIKFSELFKKINPDWVIVFGDVSSTVAAAMAAKYIGYRIAHVEAGVRSFNLLMPEEINRIVTDKISDIRFVPELSGLKNLNKEGLRKNSYYVGNIMINTLINLLPEIKEIKNQLKKENYIVVTFHRNINVDDEMKLKKIISLLNNISEKYKIIFPIHPRTKNKLHKFGLINELSDNIILKKPMDYIHFIRLIMGSKGVITDSGGIQCEASYLGIPIITLRESTEWKTTLKMSNKLINPNLSNKEIIKKIYRWFNKEHKFRTPKYWDNKVAERILSILKGIK